MDRDAPPPLNPEPLLAHIGADLFHAFRAFELAMYDEVSQRGFPDITVADSEILVFVPSGGIGLTEIAKRRRVTKQSVHEQVHSLVKRDYLALQPNPSDKRAKLVVHTPKGKALVRSLREIKSMLHARVREALGEEALHRLTRDLDRVRALLTE